LYGSGCGLVEIISRLRKIKKPESEYSKFRPRFQTITSRLKSEGIAAMPILSVDPWSQVVQALSLCQSARWILGARWFRHCRYANPLGGSLESDGSSIVAMPIRSVDPWSHVVQHLSVRQSARWILKSHVVQALSLRKSARWILGVRWFALSLMELSSS
jgi:hypothetical protein